MGRWTHPATILVATDLSDLDHLMPFALEQAGETGARLILFHVLTPSVAVISADAAGMPYYNTSTAQETAEQMLQPWCEVAARRGIRCDKAVREGHPTQQIAAAVRQFEADRVLLGTRSRSKLGKLLLGSVAEQVLRSVYLPVMTVGPEAHLPMASGERIVLHATTLRETSRPSAALACHVAAQRNAKLILLHVLPPIHVMQRKGMPTGTESKAMLELRILAEETGARCCSAVEPIVLHGNPFIEILALASDRRADLIVLGATRRATLENLTRERTIYRVLSHARCPVLTLREPQAPPADALAETAFAHSVARP
jgi:nucleotide-binding universal stress UspA family protein